MVYEWTEAELAALRRYHAAKEISIARMAIALGKSKSSVVRKIRSLRFPLRVSPFVAQPQWTEEKLTELTKLAPTMLSCAEIGASLGFSRSAVGYKLKALGLARGKGRSGRRGSSTKAPNKPLPVSRARPTGPLKAKVFKDVGSSEPCCWPIGTPRTPSFRYCDEPSMRGRPYCEQHFAAGHRDVCLREEAA
jgi:GcrA cell cycle regulator